MVRYVIVREHSSEEMKEDSTVNRFETLLRFPAEDPARKRFESITKDHPNWHLLLKSISLSFDGEPVVVRDLADNADIDILKGEPMVEIVEDGLSKDNIKTMELKDTIDIMTSPDYRDRFKAEYWQLRDRYKKLTGMLTKWDNGQLDFTPNCPRSLYTKQINAMHEYLDVLERRAELESVNLTP